ncbi:GNAT family N-acetyltransferase [Rhizobiaceae bacterium n13]|uniref:GNAT family N-acetyltransferase n=1 Tax=Ferirhizobium litorale TaxID=2927786 RepID=A0AAE3U2H2_9HYPH|nr:GNAT family N-acetyltransferase [Fererhizobium litorale]MDI7860851.1 GNAT family N-acetyltransferase [Fererhizobium litorale]MDI7920999.1 GNAT family N-acetyltransferase [Fererhizobium litorale]
MTELEIIEQPSPEDLAAIGRRLAAFNEGDVGPAERRAISVIVRDRAGKVAGGLSGYTAWGWLYVQWLVVPEDMRGQGLASRMLQAAETEARARGCHAAWIDTFNPAALRVYQRQGYSAFGELADFPVGRTRTFLQKRL